MSNNLYWPGWTLGPVIGRGAHGVVYEIQRNVYGETEKAALKVISIPRNDEEAYYLESAGYSGEDLSYRFRECVEDIVHEYRLMTQMRTNPNVVFCDDYKEVQHEDGLGWDVYIKMELLTPLMKAIDTDSPDEQAVKVGKDICNALITCHRKKIAHKDIKPQNIFVSDDGVYKIGDFGIAKVLSDSGMSTEGRGTVAFMAPEVYFKKRNYGFDIDVYSLGLVMYWLLNNRQFPFCDPFRVPTAKEEQMAHARRFDGERLPPPVNGNERLKSIVLKACAFEPRNRYASAQDMLNALQNMDRIDPSPIPLPVNLDIHKEMTFEHTNHPAGKYLSVQVDAREVHFSVPMDIKDGQTIHLTGKGKYDSSTGISGDLYITMHIKGETSKPPVSLIKKVVILCIAVLLLLPLAFAGGSFAGYLSLSRKGTDTSIGELASKPNEDAILPIDHVHIWGEATCNDPEVCSECGETRGTAIAHQWQDATYDSPEHCALCGVTRGDSVGYPLTWCREIENSNNPNAKKSTDVSIGTWTDCFGEKHSDAIKFWVSESMVDTEYIIYDVNSDYSKLVLSIVNAEDNASGGENKITIYADDEVIYRSDWITNDSPVIEKTLEIGNVDRIKVECSTDTAKYCYCLVSGLLYK